jgi:hypothetical protein
MEPLYFLCDSIFLSPTMDLRTFFTGGMLQYCQMSSQTMIQCKYENYAILTALYPFMAVLKEIQKKQKNFPEYREWIYLYLLSLSASFGFKVKELKEGRIYALSTSCLSFMFSYVLIWNLLLTNPEVP